MTNEIKHYGDRDSFVLDQAGGYYTRHVTAMVEEKLNRRHYVASELAHRDMQIDQLRAELKSVTAERDEARRAMPVPAGAELDASLGLVPLPAIYVPKYVEDRLIALAFANGVSLQEFIRVAVRDASVGMNIAMGKLIDLCGFWQDGSDETVTIFQDDATRSWAVKVGSDKRGHGPTMYTAIDDAHKVVFPNGVEA